MKKLTRLLAIPLMCGMFWGCAKTYIPEPEMLREIEQTHYIGPHVCIRKAARYANHVNACGGDAYIISGKGLKYQHAQVIVINPETGREHLIDPTQTQEGPADGFEVDKYPNLGIDYVLKDVKEEDVISFGKPTIQKLDEIFKDEPELRKIFSEQNKNYKEDKK